MYVYQFAEEYLQLGTPQGNGSFSRKSIKFIVEICGVFYIIYLASSHRKPSNSILSEKQVLHNPKPMIHHTTRALDNGKDHSVYIVVETSVHVHSTIQFGEDTNKICARVATAYSEFWDWNIVSQRQGQGQRNSPRFEPSLSQCFFLILLLITDRLSGTGYQ